MRLNTMRSLLVRCTTSWRLGSLSRYNRNMYLQCTSYMSTTPSVAVKRCRQHVNPLSARLQVPITLPDKFFESSYACPQNPFVVDIGCAKATWTMNFASENPNINVLGLDIRHPVIDIANARKSKLEFTNLHFLQSNANIDIAKIFDEINRISYVKLVTINFPDPFFKSKHVKRRLVNDIFVSTIGSRMKPDSKVFFQSDVLEVFQDIKQHFLNSTLFSAVNDEIMLSEELAMNTEHLKPSLTLYTERELACMNKSLPIYRFLVVRK